MKLKFSKNRFDKTFIGRESKLTHYTGVTFRLFPFTTNKGSESITDLNEIIGGFINRIQSREPEQFHTKELIDKLKSSTSISSGYIDIFEDVIRSMFFNQENKLLPINLFTLEHNECITSTHIKLAEYLVDVLGDKVILNEVVEDAKLKLNSQINVLERYFISNLKSKAKKEESRKKFQRITDVFKKTFEDDFKYILESKNRTKEYLTQLIEFYYFIYTSQVCLQLNNFLGGVRNSCIPLYFCLDWEKTSQSRKCFSEGWTTLLQPSVEKMFAHAVVLEILNNNDNGEVVDYITLGELVTQSEELDKEIADSLLEFTDYYRKMIVDCPQMLEMVREEVTSDYTANEIKFLFNSVICQFIHTTRIGAYNEYAKKFEDFAYKFLKRRGRSGMMLNITEETLIFLTKISIKNQEKMRLNDVFKSFEQRGIFLDNISKENVMKYYEKLNLIEKKSDSGDAQYVKRIL